MWRTVNGATYCNADGEANGMRGTAATLLVGTPAHTGGHVGAGLRLKRKLGLL